MAEGAQDHLAGHP